MNMKKPVQDMVIEPTGKTPLIRLDPGAGKLEFSGRLIPEDAIGFFLPIVDWIEEFASSRPQEVRAKVNLDYLNTSSSKCMLDVFKKLERMHADGVSVELDWCYKEEDEDMLEMGEDYQSIVDFPFKLVAEEE